MTEEVVSQEEIRAIEEFLKMYKLNRRLLRLNEYEKEYLGYREAPDEIPVEAALARAKMFETRQFVMGLPNCDEKLLIYYHYIRGESVERCAELLGISRASAYRMKKRALSRAAWKRRGDI